MARVPRTAVAAAVLLTLALPVLADGESYPDGLRPPLDEVLEAADPGELVPVSVILKEQVTRERLVTVKAGLTREEGRKAVIHTLKANALGSQGPLLSRMRAWQAEGLVARIRPLWIGNVVGVDATPDLIREIAARPEVAYVNHNPKVDVFLSYPPAYGPEAGTDGVECGTDLMGAPQVWSDFGVTGEGALIAVVDSGVCWTHSDIVNQIWVNPGEDLDGDGVVMDTDDENGVDDDGNGFVDDLIGWDFDNNDNRPNDDNSHGSHCAGTVAGDGTAGTQAGMAPDAWIMPVRVGLSFSDEVSVWDGMQYAADNGADAISMSLGWPHNQNPDRATWRQNCENTIEAGTAMVIAAGNEGSGNDPDNLRTPGDVPRIISVGATDCSDNIAGFSSRGPVTWEDVDPFNDHPYPPGLVKPDVSAPGVSTVSHNVCNGYSTKSGTSMATPHVAGAVALMVSANPGLTHDEIKQALEDTSIDLGENGKDNVYGAGRVDAYAAVDAVFGLNYHSHQLLDGNPDYDNGDGGLDTGEIVTLRVTLENNWDDETATDVEGWITTEAPGVTLVHDFATWPDVAPLGTADSLSPHFSFQIDSGCNFPIVFKLNLRYSGREGRASFSVRVGSPFDRALIDDDFESDQGWSVGGTSATGVFVREDPNGFTDSTGRAVQPEDDATPDPGVKAWVTGNDDMAPGDDDVDDGDSTVTTPVLDATDFESATLTFSHWFYANPESVPSSNFLRVHWSRDGATWNDLTEVTGSHTAWKVTSVPIPPSAFGPGLRIRFQVDDPEIGMGTFDSVVEGLIDDVNLSGSRIECDLFEPPSSDPPNPVGNSLVVARIGSDVRLDWTPPPVDAGHGAATVYRIYRSADPSGGFTGDRMSTEPWNLDAGEALEPDSWYMLVVSENGGGSSGEEPQ